MPDESRKLIVLSLKWYDLRIHQGVLKYAREQNWDVVASPHMHLALDIPEAAGQIVMIGSPDRQRLAIAQKYNHPVVDIGNYHPEIPLPRVLTDNRTVGRLAAQAFAKRGFKHTVIFSTQAHAFPNDRTEGFLGEAKASGLHCDQWHISQPDSHKGSYDLDQLMKSSLTQKLLKAPKPLAVFAIEDDGAALLQRACLRLGIYVPEEVSIIGVNNDPLICPYATVPISSIDLNWEEVGYRAAALLNRLMKGGKPPPRNEYIAPQGLVVRQSSDVDAVEDLRVARALTYIRNHCHQPVSVKDIATHLAMPLRTLQWAFKQSRGNSLNDEIQAQRLEKTQELLIENDQKLSDIADQLGFSSAQHLNNYFTKLTGITPNEFRRQNKES
jgi:LacI family transcriptional regulator